MMVTRGLSFLIQLTEDAKPNEALQALAEKHDRNNLNITPELYPKYIMRTLKKFDPDVNPELEKLLGRSVST
jgi:hypothetical protein